MMKRRFFAILLAGVLALSLAACGGGGGSSDGGSGSSGGSSSSGGVTLTLMGNANDLAKNYMTSIFEQYESATGNKLDFVSIEDSNFDTVATSKFATGDIPDLFMHFNNSTLNNYNVESNFYYMNDESWIGDLTDGAKAYCEDGSGNILGLPFWESSVSGCYYNKTLFDELGLKPATTQAEFDTLCQALVDAGHTAICWPANGCCWMYQFGLDPLFADDPALLEKINSNQIAYADIPAVESMLEWVKSAADKGWFGGSYLTDGWSDISTIMGTGEAGMVFIWDTWFYTDFDEGNGYTKEDFALMPVFMNTADQGTYEGGNLNMLMVNKNSQNLEAALDFIRFCATAENYNKAFEGVSTVSCFKGQTTNIQSEMVTDAMDSINKLQRTSTAEPKVIGYTQRETGSAVQELFLGNVDAAGCVKLMDDYRMTSAKALGTPGF
ncbi:extracellular solute-binding protein [uncultured Oscillibacter sp.]|uniref:ABC transporter substrate-binding protein n=1 Tax=uncultured Oscillibacter sp. TaxID=876091 RepID=UPI00261CCFA1|nr:extracellular solute-binding protein [uncultured Oscillibacter sp.]